LVRRSPHSRPAPLTMRPSRGATLFDHAGEGKVHSTDPGTLLFRPLILTESHASAICGGAPKRSGLRCERRRI
jgi:hypothetical protein